MKVCKTKEGECHDRSKDHFVSHLSPGKMPSLDYDGKILSLSQILNAIDVELTEGNCLDCEKYIDRRVLSTKSALKERGPIQRRRAMAPEIEKRQQGRIAVRLLGRMVTSRSVMWKEKRRI